ncbi:MAG: polyamine ABC transporter permease, partial [Pseudomonadota bacterium]|nr:polyamine ABC transporter permease [Pseudomonadota bacterium]
MSLNNKKWSWIAIMPMMVLYICLFLWPVISFLLLSIGGNISSPSLEYFEKILQTPIYTRILYNTFSIAAFVTIISVIFSYPIVYLLINVSRRTRRFLFILVLLPFWTSALVRTTAWIVILQRNGILNDLLLSI